VRRDLRLARSRSIAALLAQPSFPDGAGIVQTSCRCRMVRRAAASPRVPRRRQNGSEQNRGAAGSLGGLRGTEPRHRRCDVLATLREFGALPTDYKQAVGRAAPLHTTRSLPARSLNPSRRRIASSFQALAQLATSRSLSSLGLRPTGAVNSPGAVTATAQVPSCPARKLKDAYTARRAVLPTAEIKARIDQLLAVGGWGEPEGDLVKRSPSSGRD
jgi:hypothetical protein